jgi:DNA-binding GntR family transcriptional regulator
VDATKADQIAAALEQAITSGQFEPGSVLRQEQLSAQFHVSRTPVREALRRVAALGLVSFTPNRGVRVHALDPERWHEAFLIRASLESLAAELAATRITDAELEALVDAENEFARLTDELRDPSLGESERTSISFVWAQANYRFHDVILAAAAAPTLEQMAKAVRRSSSRVSTWASGSDIDRIYDDNVRQHTAIRQALAGHSAAGAQALARDHVLLSWHLHSLMLEEGTSRRGGVTVDGDGRRTEERPRGRDAVNGQP